MKIWDNNINKYLFIYLFNNFVILFFYSIKTQNLIPMNFQHKLILKFVLKEHSDLLFFFFFSKKFDISRSDMKSWLWRFPCLIVYYLRDVHQFDLFW